MKAISLAIQKIWPMLKFLKSESNFKVKVQGQKFWYQQKGLAIRNTHVNYEALSPTIQKIWPMLKFLQTDRQTDGQAKNYMLGGIKIYPVCA
jgi:uncharacterized protein YcfL